MLAIDRGSASSRGAACCLFGFPHGSYAYYAGVDLLAGAGRLRAAEDVLPLVWRATSATRPTRPPSPP